MRTGFTLLEVLVAVMVAATLLLSADLVFEQQADSRDALSRATLDRNRTQNARKLIQRWVRQADVSPNLGLGSAEHAFAGDATGASFTSACLTAGGWEHECDVSLSVKIDSSNAALIAVSSTGDSARIAIRGTRLSLRYLSDAASGGHWVTSWPAGPTVPIAIGVISPTDTIVYRIGARG
jgi:prepilin-type N-terminal cleavage/methylation domain-containing protein